MACAHPRGDRGHEREPEQQVEVGPHGAAADAAGGPQQVMVIVPVNADERETQHVDQQPWDPIPQRVEGGARRRPELQHHYGNNHGEHPIAEAFQACRTSCAEQVSPTPQRATHAEAFSTLTACTTG